MGGAGQTTAALGEGGLRWWSGWRGPTGNAWGAYRPSDWSEAAQRLLLAIDEAVSRARERRTAGRGEDQAALWQTERDLPAGSTIRLESADRSSPTEGWRAMDAVVVSQLTAMAALTWEARLMPMLQDGVAATACLLNSPRERAAVRGSRMGGHGSRMGGHILKWSLHWLPPRQRPGAGLRP
eukprot:3117898-Pleurochrysis_carterae.AAC.2